MDNEQPIGKALQSWRKAQGLTQEQLAAAAGIPYTTLTKVESGAIKNPSVQIVWKLSQALGVTVDTLLVPRVLQGEESLREIWNDVFSSMQQPGEYMCITGVDESQYLQFDNSAVLGFIEQLKARGLSQKLICCEGDSQFLPGDHLEYRSIPPEHFSPTPTYVYADRVAFLIWGPPTQAIIMQNQFLADAFRKQFMFIWERAQPIRSRTSRPAKRTPQRKKRTTN